MIEGILLTWGITGLILTCCALIGILIDGDIDEMPKAIAACTLWPIALLVLVFIGARQWRDEIFSKD